MTHLQNEDLSFDFSVCTNYVGSVSCGDVEGLTSEFLLGAQKIKNFMAHLDETGQRLFDKDGKRFLESDITLYRSPAPNHCVSHEQNRYRYYAIYESLFCRPRGALRVRWAMSQPDLGSFADPMNMDNINLVTTDKTITLSIYGGFTAIGAYVLPGQPFTIERLDEEAVDLYFKINTQRTGSTREWNDNKYDRPECPQSPEMPVETGAPVTYTSPYGGTLQVISDAAETAPTITLRLTLVGENTRYSPILLMPIPIWPHFKAANTPSPNLKWAALKSIPKPTK